MTLIPMNIHLRISTKFRQINSPTQIQWLFIAPTGKGNMYWLAAQDKWKCAIEKLSLGGFWYRGSWRDTSRSKED